MRVRQMLFREYQQRTESVSESRKGYIGCLMIVFLSERFVFPLFLSSSINATLQKSSADKRWTLRAACACWLERKRRLEERENEFRDLSINTHTGSLWKFFTWGGTDLTPDT